MTTQAMTMKTVLNDDDSEDDDLRLVEGPNSPTAGRNGG